MNLNNIKNTKFLKGAFKMIQREFESKYTIEDFITEAWILEEISGYIRDVLNVPELEDIDFIYATYVLNYRNVEGDFSILDHDDEEILFPEKKEFRGVETHWSQVFFKSEYIGSYYLPCMMDWDIQDHAIEPLNDAACNIQDINDTWDKEISIEENRPPKPRTQFTIPAR